MLRHGGNRAPGPYLCALGEWDRHIFLSIVYLSVMDFGNKLLHNASGI